MYGYSIPSQGTATRHHIVNYLGLLFTLAIHCPLTDRVFMIFTTPKSEDICKCLGLARSPRSRSTTVLFLLWDCYDLERPNHRRKRHLHVGRTNKVSGSAKPYICHYVLIHFRLQSHTKAPCFFPGLFDRTHVRLIMGRIVPVLVTNATQWQSCYRRTVRRTQPVPDT